MRTMLALTLSMATASVAAAPGGHCGEAAEPILTVADFNGDGTVNGGDVAMIRRAINEGEYIAFFDRNADGFLDSEDHLATVSDMRKPSSLLDQQIASVFHATKKYRSLSAAQGDGYRVFTQNMEGHGIHYARLPFRLDASGARDASYENPIDDSVEITQPEGLNYDADGNLVAVFYYHGLDVEDINEAEGNEAAISQLIETGLIMGYLMRDHFLPHDAFAGDDETWHSHVGACWDNLDYIAMQQPGAVYPLFNQHMTPEQCSNMPTAGASAWSPAFNMLHLWLYELNPCGKFAGTHPYVSQNGPTEPFFQPLEDWAAQMGLPLIGNGHGGGH